jgi:holo-[acyl-carrier protein] synthase
MILRTGIDLIEIQRFEEINKQIFNRFLKRVFTTPELEMNGETMVSLAGRFAAKEAAVKALGTGIGQVHWKDVEIFHDPEGAPFLKFSGEAAKKALDLGLKTWSVSISHSHTYAVSLVIAMGE